MRAWRALAVEAENPFALPDWHEAWCAAHPVDAPLIFVCRRAGGAVAGVVALVTRGSGRRRTLLAAGADAVDFAAPACAPADTAAVADALLGELARTRRPFDVWRLERCVAGDAWQVALAAAARAAGFTVLPWRAEPALVVADLSAAEPLVDGRQRREVGRLRRRLVAGHEVVVRASAGPQEAVHDLSVLMRLHAARWGADSFPPSVRAFHLDFAARAAEHDWLRLHTLEVDGRPAAVLYGWRLNTRAFAYAQAFDATFARHGVGVQLLAAAVEQAAAEGAERYDMLRGDERHKQHFRIRSSALESHLVVRRRSPALLEALARSAVRRAWARLPARGRALIGRPPAR